MNVLIVDDDPISREMLATTLEEAGHDVLDLAEPVGLTRALFQQEFDAVVLDVMMPSIQGDQLSKAIRQHSRGQRVAIVLVSGRSAHELSQLGAAAHADAVVPKDRAMAELSDTVIRACAERRRKLAEQNA